jgi:hypothetical protein
VHSIIVLTIPALFIGCGAPVGALFDDSPPKIQLPEVVEVPVEVPVPGHMDEILSRRIHFNNIDSGYHYDSRCTYYDIYYWMINNSMPGDVFLLYDGLVALYGPEELVEMAMYLQINWGHLYNMQKNESYGGQNLNLEINPSWQP